MSNHQCSTYCAISSHFVKLLQNRSGFEFIFPLFHAHTALLGIHRLKVCMAKKVEGAGIS